MNVTLRKLAPSDAVDVVRWRNENAAAFGDSRPLTIPRHREWYRKAYLADPRDHMYIVLADGRPAGTIGAYLHASLHGQGTREIQRVLLGDKSLARAGVMTAALRCLTDLYGPGWYWLRVLPGNTAAIAFYERNGFTRAGLHDGYLRMERREILDPWQTR